jgi:hypothetical protein
VSWKIFECRIETEDGKTLVGARQVRHDSTILFQGKEMSLKPSRYVTAYSKWSELRRSNDSVYFHFSCPTIDPEIELSPVTGFHISPSFGSASSDIEEVFTGRQVLSGTYLPYHYMVVRWWPELDS